VVVGDSLRRQKILVDVQLHDTAEDLDDGPRLVPLPKVYSLSRRFLTHAWSIKYRLKKLIAQFVTNLRDESFKPN